MKTALIKDTFREIKRSFSRFLSIFIIVFLGCGFYSGVNATMPDMKITAEKYFEDTNLMDLRLVSTIGIKAENIADVKRLDCVDGVMAGYSKDVLLKSKDNKNQVLKMMSWNGDLSDDNDNLNHLVLVKGRLPEKSGECVVDEKFVNDVNFQIGKTLTINSPSSEESITDTFATDTFKIVGVVTSPLYIGYERDKTNIGNGTVYGYVYVREDDFVSDYYSEMFLTLKDCDYKPFSEEYLERVESCKEEITQAFNQSVDSRFQNLYSMYETKLESAKTSVQKLEAILESGLDELYELRNQTQEKVSELELKTQTNTSNFIKIELQQTKQSLLRLDELILAKQNGDENVISGFREELDEAKAETETAEKELVNLKNPVVLSYNRYSSSDYGSFDSDSQKIHSIAKVFPAFFILVAALVCLTTMTRMVEEQRIQIGTYKALGYSPLRIASKYLVYGILAAVSGSVLGTLVGVKTLPTVIYNCYKILYNIPELETQFDFKMTVLCAVVSLCLTSVTIIYACYKELASQPSQLMRPKAPKSGRRVLLERFPKIWNKLDFTSKVTVRNLLRYKKRFFMTVVGVAGCTALILTGFALKNSISAILDLQFENVLNYDGLAIINSSDYSPDECKNEISEIDGITDAMLASQINGEVKNDNEHYSVNLVIFENTDESYKYVSLQERKSKNKIVIDNRGVVVTEKLCSLLGLEKGDKISIDLDEKGIYEFEISAITENYAMHYVYVSPELYENVVEKPQFNSCFFNINDGEKSEDSVAQQLAKSKKVHGTTFLKDNGDNFSKSLGSLTGIVWLLIGCAGALAMVVLYNLANINITERIREIATIKVLGFYDGETSAYIFRENVISSVIGIAIGWVLGIFLHRFVVITAEVDVVMFERSVVWWAYLFSAALTVLFTAIINVVLHFRLKKVDMVESLKSIE